MSGRYSLRDPVNENRIVNRRLAFAAGFSIILFSILMLRLGILQVLEHEHFELLSDNNRIDIIPLPPQRGLIFDRNGVVLAENIPSYSLEMIPEKVPDIELTLSGLAQLMGLSALQIEELTQQVAQQREFRQIVVKERLSDQEVAVFSVNRHRFPGVDIVSRVVRHYPHGALFAHAVGYVGRINEEDKKKIDRKNYQGTLQIGKTGVEKYYEALLHGEVGYQQVETNVRGRIIRELKTEPSTTGQGLFLNLDMQLQKVASEAISDYNGAVVVMDPNTGGILALLSKPDFDPNLFVSGISRKDYSLLRDSTERPLFDRALRGHYPPGSTLKPYVALAGLELEAIQANSKTYCPGWYSLPGREHRYRCWKEHGHGRVDLRQGMAQSCDVYYYDLANTLGIDRMHGFLDLFGFGRTTGIDLPNESSGLLPSSNWKREARNQPWYPGETLISGIGQGFNQTTPIQLAYATSLLAMRGVNIRPRIARGLRRNGQNDLTLFPIDVEQNVPIKNDKHWQEIIDSMIEVTAGQRGTARSVGNQLDFQVAGKTGTAQVFGIKQDEQYDAENLDKKLHDHALFIAFAPVENPELVIAVVVENGGSGSKVAAPIARKIIDQYFGLATDE